VNLNMKKPCADCPFLKEGAIDLREGRLDGIIETLMNDQNHFLCHKTVHCKSGGDWDEDTGKYQHSGSESQCVGSMVYLLKAGRPNVSMRMGAALKMLSYDNLKAQFNEIIEPLKVGQ
jgi:hypothetical protein